VSSDSSRVDNTVITTTGVAINSMSSQRLEPDPTEQAALAELRDLRRQGNTLRGAAATLNSRGHRTRRGTDWQLESVARVPKQNALPPQAKPTSAGSPLTGLWQSSTGSVHVLK
jgi:hypothetical protein